MYTATAPISTPDTITRPRPFSRPGILGGIGGLVFVAVVLVQNAIRAGFPANDASAEEVLTYYADHRGATTALAALFPIGAAAIATFVGTVVSKAVRGRGRVAAIAGAVGSAALVGTFLMVTATDLAISGYVHRGAASESIVEALWVTHNATFGVLLAALGVTFGALATAAARHGLVSRRWHAAGLVGGGLLLAGAMNAPAIIDGSPVMLAGAAGFLAWLAFMVRTSVALLRGRDD